MSQYQRPSPWNPGYAVPKYVLAEPQGRGTFTTKQEPRGTIGTLPPNRQIWNRTKWAVPDYAQGRYDKTPFVTNMLPRRTVSRLLPDIFQRPGSGPVATGSTLDGSSLGTPTTARKQDPIAAFGTKTASWIVTNLMKVPASQQAAALKGLLDKIDPSLNATVQKNLLASGRSSKKALESALALSFSTSMVNEFIKMGKGSSPGPMMDLGQSYQDLGFGLGTITGAISSAGSFIAHGISKIGGLACTVSGSPLTTVAAGAAGGPGAAVGVQVAAGVCGKGGSSSSSGGSGQQQQYNVAPPPPKPFPIVPVALAGAAAVALIVLLK